MRSFAVLAGTVRRLRTRAVMAGDRPFRRVTLHSTTTAIAVPAAENGIQACASSIVRNVKPLKSNQSTGIGNRSGTSRLLAPSKSPSVVIAVGSGAIPKTSVFAHDRPNNHETRG